MYKYSLRRNQVKELGKYAWTCIEENKYMTKQRPES